MDFLLKKPIKCIIGLRNVIKIIPNFFLLKLKENPEIEEGNIKSMAEILSFLFSFTKNEHK